MRRGMVVEQPTTLHESRYGRPCEDNKNCQPQVQQGTIFCNSRLTHGFLLIEGRGQVENLPQSQRGTHEGGQQEKRVCACKRISKKFEGDSRKKRRMQGKF
jgi:hypothetical protein